MTDNWLFDGEGVDWSDLAAAKSLGNQEQMRRQLEQIKQQRQSRRAKRVEGSQCPHCGGSLPADAASKQYPVCMHCRNKLLWATLTPTLTVPCNHCGRGILILRDRIGHPVNCTHCKKQSLAGVSPNDPASLALKEEQKRGELDLFTVGVLIFAACSILFLAYLCFGK
jgi:hypothetical protein